jgi:hypothetical protein
MQKLYASESAPVSLIRDPQRELEIVVGERPAAALLAEGHDAVDRIADAERYRRRKPWRSLGRSPWALRMLEKT